MFSTDFIAATKEYCSYTKHIPAPYLRKSFNVNEKIQTAKITICGLGFFELFINGRRVSDGSSLAECYRCPNPNCGYHIFRVFDSEHYCVHCGQALDWDAAKGE